MDAGNVSQESLEGPILFIMFTIEMEEAVDQTPVKLADDIKQVREFIILSCDVAIQQDLFRLAEWSKRNLMKANFCTVLNSIDSMLL